MEDSVIPINQLIDDDIEILDEDFEPIENKSNLESLPINNNLNNDSIIPIDKLFETERDNELTQETNIQLKKEGKMVEKIQIFLIIFLIVVATLVYFFGYDLFEPFIKIDGSG